MSSFISFLASNYIWFLVITLILIFALIGYFVDNKKDEKFLRNLDENEKLNDEMKRKLDAASAANITLNQMVNYEVESLDDPIVTDEKNDKKNSSK